MANLADTYNITLHRKHTFKDGVAYYSVPVFGDGNCALNTFALWMTDAIKRDALILDAAKQRAFMRALTNATSLNALKERVKFYRGKPSATKNARNAYGDVANDLESFINFIDVAPVKRKFAELCEYIQTQHSREAMAALQVGLAPALRQLGVEAYLAKLRGILLEDENSAHPLIKDAISLFEDGKDAGQETLAHLAKDFFGVNFALYNSEGVDVSESELIPNAPVIAIVHSGDSSGHFDFLLPAGQVKAKTGIVTNIPNLTIATTLQEQVAILKGKRYLTQENVVEVASVVDEAAQGLLQGTGGFIDGNALANLSIAAASEVRRKYNLTDANLASLGITSVDTQKLLQKGAAVDSRTMSEDEAIAYTLQNAEILAFYQENHDALVRHPAIYTRNGRMKAESLAVEAASWPRLFDQPNSPSGQSATSTVNSRKLAR